LTHNFQDSLPAWSPDGTQFAFNQSGNGDQVSYWINASGNDWQLITSQGGIPDLVSP
jgi:Tol biopolymer transport system component